MILMVRPAVAADLPAVDALLARCYPRLLKADYPPSLMVTALPLISRAQPALVVCGTYFVVEKDDVIIGAGGWTARQPGGGPATPGTAHIRHVVTDDRQVRRGVGTLLMGHIVSTARAAGVRRLECLSTLTARAFYQAMGFVVQGPVNVPLAPGIDFPAVAMTRRV